MSNSEEVEDGSREATSEPNATLLLHRSPLQCQFATKHL